MLMDPRVRRFFLPFLACDRTVGEAAAEAGCSPPVMLYRVGTFLRAGLLRVVHERPRAGRALKVYRSVHDAYLVPFSLMPYADLEEGFAAHFHANASRIAELVARRFRGRSWDGTRLYRRTDGETRIEGAPDAQRVVGLLDPARPVGMDFTTEIGLSEQEARALQAELLRLLELRRPGEGRRGYLLSVALVPLDDEGT